MDLNDGLPIDLKADKMAQEAWDRKPKNETSNFLS